MKKRLMTEHPTKQQLDEYCRRVLAPAVFLPVHRHVANVFAVCAAQCNSPEYAARDLANLREAFIPAVLRTRRRITFPKWRQLRMPRAR